MSTEKTKGQVPPLSHPLQRQLVDLLKILADEKRMQIIVHLGREGEAHVSRLCDLLDQSQPAVSHHLGLMREAGIIERRRGGKHNYYSIRPEPFQELAESLFDVMTDGNARSVQLGRVVVQRAN